MKDDEIKKKMVLSNFIIDILVKHADDNSIEDITDEAEVLVKSLPPADKDKLIEALSEPCHPTEDNLKAKAFLYNNLTSLLFKAVGNIISKKQPGCDKALISAGASIRRAKDEVVDRLSFFGGVRADVQSVEAEFKEDAGVERLTTGFTWF